MIVSRRGGGRRILPAVLLWGSSVALLVLVFLLLEAWAWTTSPSTSHATLLSSSRGGARSPRRLSSAGPSHAQEAGAASSTSLLPPPPPLPPQQRPLPGTSQGTRRKGSAASAKRRQRHPAASRPRSSEASEEPPFPERRALPRSIPRLSDLLEAPPQAAAAQVEVEAPLVSRDIRRSRANRTASTVAPAKRRFQRPLPGRAEVVAGARKQPDEDEGRSEGEPWRASYRTSCKTQQRIKDAAAGSGLSPSMAAQERSALVLRTFLDTPPERTNPANLVCALTSSAKVLALAPGSRMTDRGLELFFRATDVLDRMMSAEDVALSGRQLCNAIWAIARHYERDRSVLPAGGQRAALSSPQAFGVAETWDFSALERAQDSPARRVDHLVDRVAAEITRQLGLDPASIKEGELSMACWACGVLRPRSRPPGWKHGPQVASVQRRRQPPSDEAERSAVLTLKFESWSSSSVDADDELESSDPPNEVDKLFDAVGRALLVPSNSTHHEERTTRVAACQWKELANLAWAFASHGRSCSMDSQKVLLEIAHEAARRLRQQHEGQDGKPVLSRDISQIIWSLGILQTDNYRLADGLVELVDALVDFSGVRSRSATTANIRPFLKWSCADLVQVVLSLAHARVDEPDLLRHMFREAAHRLERDGQTSLDHPTRAESSSRVSFHAWEVSILLWSQARLYLREPQGRIFDRFAHVATSYLCERADGRESLAEIGIGAQEQANIAWSLTLLEEYQDPNTVQLLARIFHEAARTCKQDGIIHLEHAHQLWQALFLLEDECPEAVQSVPRWFHDYLQDKWTAEKSRSKVSSARHKALSQTLTAMGVAHKNEHDEDIDVAIVLKPSASWVHETTSHSDDDSRRTAPTRSSSGGGRSLRLAVEFDGPNHFTRQKPAASPFEKPETPRALGHTVLKYRLLKKQGWVVVRVPYYEFDRIPFWASMERQRYLQRMLKTHGNLQFSRVDVSEYKPQVPNRQSRYD